MSNLLITIILLISLLNSIQSQNPQLQKIINYLPDIRTDYSITKQMYDEIHEIEKAKAISEIKKQPLPERRFPPPPPGQVIQGFGEDGGSIASSQNNNLGPMISYNIKQAPEIATRIVNKQQPFIQKIEENKVDAQKFPQFKDHKLQPLQDIIFRIRNIDDTKVVKQDVQNINSDSTPKQPAPKIQTEKPSVVPTNTIASQQTKVSQQTIVPQQPIVQQNAINKQEQIQNSAELKNIQAQFNKLNEALGEVNNMRNNKFFEQFKRFPNIIRQNMKPKQTEQTQVIKQRTQSKISQAQIQQKIIQNLQRAQQQKKNLKNNQQTTNKLDKKQSQTLPHFQPKQIHIQTPTIQQTKPQIIEKNGQPLIKKLFLILFIISIAIIIFSYTPQQKKQRPNKSYNPTLEQQQTGLA